MKDVVSVTTQQEKALGAVGGKIAWVVALFALYWAWQNYIQLPMRIDTVIDNKIITVFVRGQKQHFPLSTFIGLYDPDDKRLRTGGLVVESFIESRIIASDRPSYKVRYKGVTLLVNVMTETVAPVDQNAKDIFAAEGRHFGKGKSILD